MIAHLASTGAHFARRGVEHVSATYLGKRGDESTTIDIPVWGMVLMAATFIFFGIVLSSIEYTLKDVIATLAMVETPSAAITVSPADIEDSEAPLEKDGLLQTAPTITLVRQKPITSKIRATIRHLKAQGGRCARWRGLASFIFYTFVMGMTTNFFDTIVPRIPGRLVLISAVSGALCASLHAGWTHTVISMPSEKRFHKRIPLSAWKQLALPGAVKASAGYVATYLCMGFIQLLQLHDISGNDFSDYGNKEWCSLVLRIFAVILFAVWSALFVVLPATVTLVRVEASLLPEEDDTIVPFDRTFGGKVVAKILGGTGAIGFVDAWRTFDWEARRRLVKHYLKTFLVIVVVMIAMVHVVALEFWAIMGPAVGKALAQAKHGQF